MSVQKTDDPAVRATKNMTARRHGAGYGTILTEEENVDIIREAYAAREQAVKELLDWLEHLMAEDTIGKIGQTSKKMAVVRELYGL